MHHDELYDRLRAIDPLLPLAATVLLKRCDDCTCGWSAPDDPAQGAARLRRGAEQARRWEAASIAAVREDPTVTGWFDACEAQAETEETVHA